MPGPVPVLTLCGCTYKLPRYIHGDWRGTGYSGSVVYPFARLEIAYEGAATPAPCRKGRRHCGVGRQRLRGDTARSRAGSGVRGSATGGGEAVRLRGSRIAALRSRPAARAARSEHRLPAGRRRRRRRCGRGRHRFCLAGGSAAPRRGLACRDRRDVAVPPVRGTGRVHDFARTPGLRLVLALPLARGERPEARHRADHRPTRRDPAGGRMGRAAGRLRCRETSDRQGFSQPVRGTERGLRSTRRGSRGSPRPFWKRRGCSVSTGPKRAGCSSWPRPWRVAARRGPGDGRFSISAPVSGLSPRPRKCRPPAALRGTIAPLPARRLRLAEGSLRQRLRRRACRRPWGSARPCRRSPCWRTGIWRRRLPARASWWCRRAWSATGGARPPRFVPNLKLLVLHGPDRRHRFPEIPEHHLVVTTYPLPEPGP